MVVGVERQLLTVFGGAAPTGLLDRGETLPR